MTSRNPLEAAVFRLYASLKMGFSRHGSNAICTACKANTPDIMGPISLWQAGSRFQDDPYRLAFVGKTARGTIRSPVLVQPELDDTGFIDGTVFADGMAHTPRGAYWGYMTATLNELFGSVEEGWERIVYTNLVKCNNSMDRDLTTPLMRRNCLDQLRVVWKELGLLEPRHVIFFVGQGYDEFLARADWQWPARDVTHRQHRVRVGAKLVPWWERECVGEGGAIKARLLRTGHPERLSKGEFVRELIGWVKGAEAVVWG